MHQPTPVRFSLPQDPIILMIYKLRFANARYARVAEEMRAKRKNRPFCGSYRVRAAWLGLRVNIDSAVNCPPKEVSKLPLPVLETTPSPVEPKITIRIPVSHVRSTSVPSITTTAPTPMGRSTANRSEIIYAPIPPIRIPARPSSVQNVSSDWRVPGAPLLKTKELPGVSPQSYFSDSSPMSLDSDSSGPLTPEDQDAVALRIRLPGKRKMDVTDSDDMLPHKHQLRRRWSQAPSTRVAPSEMQENHAYF